MRISFVAIPALLLLASCAPVIVGGAAAVGTASVQERTVGAAVDDLTIHTRILNGFSKQKGLFTNVSVKVQEGSVLLTGKVKNPEDAVEAVKAAWAVEGVREVINEIQVTDRNTIGGFANDSLITTQVKSRLIAEKFVKSVNYSIETVGGVVYVMGIAQDDAELERVLNVTSRVRGVKQVVSHVRLKTDPRRNVANP